MMSFASGTTLKYTTAGGGGSASGDTKKSAVAAAPPVVVELLPDAQRNRPGAAVAAATVPDRS